MGFVAQAATPVSIGSTVFIDNNNNGLLDGSDAGIGSVTVELLYDANNNGVIDGDETSPIATTTTTTTGSIGNYFFGNLTPGNYQVRIPTPPLGFGTSSAITATTDNPVENDDNGTQTGGAGTATVSPIINLAVGAEPTNTTETGQGGTADDSTVDANGDMTIDFGFVATYSLGNRVWFDTNNNGQINTGEAGINNISVSLFSSTNLTTPLATTTTDSLGYYRFDNLPAGNYVVRINPSNFAAGAALIGYQNTSGNTAADLDSTATAGQNGEDGINPTGAANTIQTNGILSNTITLGAAAEPTAETDVQTTGQGSLDNQANMTVDFGFYRLNLSGTVWRDTGAGANNNNGTLDTGEVGIASITVRLYDSANVEIPVGPDGILGTADDAVGGMITNAGGNYNFQSLPAGIYRVVITPSGAPSSTPTSTTPDDNINSNDDGTPQTAGVFSGRITSGLVTLTPGNAGALSNNTVTNASGLTSDPTVDFGLLLAATAVELENFEAFANVGGVTLKWTTGGETDNLGFNVYRETNGKRERLNASPIAGSALRSSANLQVSGDSYSWFDAKTEPDSVYYLEDIDLDGTTNLHGAVSAKMQLSSVNADTNSNLLDDLSQLSAAPVQTDSTDIVTAKQKAGGKNAQSKIAARSGVKISVRNDGWYRISAAQLQNAGFEINSNQADWQMFANGEEVALKVNSDNSVEFFGRGLDTRSTDKKVYYLTVGNQQGQRITEVKGGSAGERADTESFRNVAVRRDRGIYASAILNGEAENWFGAVVSPSGQTDQDLTVYNPDATGGNARLTVKLQGLTINDHLVSVRFNNFDLGTISYSNHENRPAEFDIPTDLLRSGTNRVSLQAIGSGSDFSVVDSITLNYSRLYKAEGDRLRFTVPAGQTVRVGGFSTGEFEIYEIRGGTVSSQIAAKTEKTVDTYGFSLAAVNSNREFLAVGKTLSETAVSVENDQASDWRSPSNKADFVIITPNAFRQSAEKLAQMRQSQGLKTEVVAVEDLYDEFTFGTHSPVAVQEFLRTAASKWTVKPQYALLFGDSSYDSRNYLGGINRDLVPTKLIDTGNLETASDASLADFDNDGIEDIALGRLPAVNQTEAEAMISKIQRYEQRTAREERANLFVADTNFENYSNTLRDLLPESVGSTLVNRTGATDGEMRQNLLDKLNLGATVVTYSGHGSTTLLGNNTIFRNEDALNLNNRKLSLYLMMTCLNGFTHNAGTDSLAESLVKSNNGAIAVWASSGTTGADGQAQLSRTATNLLFNSPQPLRIGVIIRTAKQATGDQDIRRTWQLIGDPTIFIR